MQPCVSYKLIKTSFVYFRFSAPIPCHLPPGHWCDLWPDAGPRGRHSTGLPACPHQRWRKLSPRGGTNDQKDDRTGRSSADYINVHVGLALVGVNLMCRPNTDGWELHLGRPGTEGSHTHIGLVLMGVIHVGWVLVGVLRWWKLPICTSTCICVLVGVILHIKLFNTLRPRQHGRHFADDTFKCIFLNEHVGISIKISLKFVHEGPINNIPALVQIMAWRRPGDTPLSEPMMVRLPTHIYVARPQWVNQPIYCFVFSFAGCW